MQNDTFSQANPPDSPVAQPPVGIKPLTREESKAELNRAIHDAEEILFRESTMFPFTPFPHTLTVDRTKVTVTKRFFFLMAETQSFRIEDILSASCTVGPFFGGVMIISRIMNKEQEINIGPFWRSDAERAKRIIHGYIIAKQRAIDTSQLRTKELCDMLNRLGEDNHQ
ncbi:hypothetical protein KDA06_00885 [Candidatus Saccharibacteria bacterium]|jgi:hypothetical protein|nr:hypothetical protein [Candidatus Saccharibacteria bacterium]HPR09442.1 hypothetical protein [Candidatus Saccharibacteria bacterium]